MHGLLKKSMAHVKGQTISKGNYGVFNSPKKRTLGWFSVHEIIPTFVFGRIEDTMNCYRDLLTFIRNKFRDLGLFIDNYLEEIVTWYFSKHIYKVSWKSLNIFKPIKFHPIFHVNYKIRSLNVRINCIFLSLFYFFKEFYNFFKTPCKVQFRKKNGWIFYS